MWKCKQCGGLVVQDASIACELVFNKRGGITKIRYHKRRKGESFGQFFDRRSDNFFSIHCTVCGLQANGGGDYGDIAEIAEWVKS